MVSTLQNKIVILGAGVAGISAAYHLRQKGFNPVIYEKDSDWGGLCGNFTINGFRFDRFVHFTFAPDEQTSSLFEASSPTYSHPSVSSNYYKGFWLKHPAQNNLAPLPVDEKVSIITDFISRPQVEQNAITNYEQWLYCQYGKYFAEHFPFAYTRKYWGVEPKSLETKWVGIRMHSPDLEEILRGSYETQSTNFYYTKFMKYPKVGGFRSLFDKSREGTHIEFNKKVIQIDALNKIVSFSDHSEVTYDTLISSIPLPEMVHLVKDCPQSIKDAASKLRWTCGYQISLGFNRPDVAKYLWFYIYDEDILPARVYSPNLKSKDNVPDGCSSLQAEVFYANGSTIPDKNEVLQKTISKLKEICDFSEEDIVVKDIRFEPHANVIFTHDIYESREVIKQWLIRNQIKTIGRFGLWDYLWSHQAFGSGKNECCN